MARVQVVSDDGNTIIPITTDDEGWTEGRCQCGDVISDRGNFEDTIEASKIHLDYHH